MNGIDYFDRGWAMGSSTPCMIDAVTGADVTYDEVRKRTLRIGNALRSRNYGPDRRGAVLGYNDQATFTTFLSLVRAGMAVIPLNPRNAPQDNGWILESFDCEILFFSESFAPIVPQLREAAPNIRDFVCIGEAAGYVGLDTWIGGHDESEFEIEHDPDRVYLIQPTGGTTGMPKGVMVPNRAMENHVANMMAVAPCPERPVFLAAAPLTHAAGYVMQTVLAQNGTAIVMAKFEKSLFLESIGKHGVTHTFLPPTAIYDLLEHSGVEAHDYSSLRYFIYGASPMAPDKIRKAIEIFGPVLCQVYGQSEASFPNTFMAPSDHMDGGAVASRERLSSCGKATPFCRVAILADGEQLADGEIGEIAIRSSGIMLGYFRNEAATQETRCNGWHLTGDIGYRDKDGYYYIVDRKKDMIISGGFNIYSVEVETALLSHPAVQNCAVIGIPDPKWGEVVAAEVELVEGARVSEDEIIAYCKQRIGSMKAPKRVAIVQALPRSAVGKILKRDIRTKYWKDKGRLI